MSSRFELEHVPAAATGEPAVLKVRGELDTLNAAEFEAAVRERRARDGLILSLSGVAYCDSAAFAALDRLVANGDVVLVIEAGNPVRKAATVVGLPFVDSAEQAGAGLPHRGSPA